MSNTGRGFRFSIGQGMVVIALLAVLFASLPMPLAINVAFATTCLVAIGRNRLLTEPIGCVLCLLGLLVGPAALVSWLRNPRTDDLDVLSFVFITGSMIIGGLGAARLRRPGPIAKPFAPHLDETQAELEVVENLLRHAHKDGDEVVISKMTEYRAKLEQKIQL